MSAGISEGEVVDALFEVRPCLGPLVTDQLVQELTTAPDLDLPVFEWLIGHVALHRANAWEGNADLRCLDDTREGRPE